MAISATITFSQAGVEPPVYVVTSLSGWTTLEMDIESERTSSGDLVFSKKFTDVDEGNYQYKIRIGEHHWVLDESKESGKFGRVIIIFVWTDGQQTQMSKATAIMSSKLSLGVLPILSQRPMMRQPKSITQIQLRRT